MNWKQTFFVFVLIVILGTSLRLYDLDRNAFVADEFLDMNAAYGYAQTGEWKAWDFNMGRPAEVNINAPRDERASLYKWQVAQLFKVLPPTEWVARSVSVLWGVVSLAAIFWATYMMTRRREIALIAMFLFALSVSGIIFDRTLRMYAMFFPLYVSAATCLFLALEKEYAGKMPICRQIMNRYGIHVHYALAALILFFLSLSVHQLTGTLLFTLAIYLGVRAFQTYRDLKKGWSKYSVLLCIGLAGLIGIALVAPGFFRSFAKEMIFFDDHYGYVAYVLRDYYHPLLAMVFLVTGGWWIAKREKMPEASLWLMLSLFVPLAMAIWLFRRNVGAQYIFFAQSFALILIAAGVFAVWKMILEKWNLVRARAVVVLALLVLLVPNFGYFFEENNTYHETSTGSNPNYRKVFAYFKKNHVETDVLVTRHGRNYYFSGAHVPVFDLGDEISRTRLSQADIERLMTEYQTGWVILSDNDYDYVGKGVKEFMNKNLMRVSNDQVRGKIDVYRW